jgi:hypothetical protein
MNNFNRIKKLANNFRTKVAIEMSQTGTTELFFDNVENQRKFSNSLQNPSGALATFLTKSYEKLNKPISFSLKIDSQPKTGASWLLTVNPPSLTGQVKQLVDLEFKRLMNQTMQERLSSAVSGAKAGGGSGRLDVASLDLD